MRRSPKTLDQAKSAKKSISKWNFFHRNGFRKSYYYYDYDYDQYDQTLELKVAQLKIVM